MIFAPDHEWDPHEGLRAPQQGYGTFPRSRPVCRRRHSSPSRRPPISGAGSNLKVTIQSEMSTNRLRSAAQRTGPRDIWRSPSTSSPPRPMSPSRPILDLGLTAGGLFARENMADTFKSERIPSTFNWEFSPEGSTHRVGIAEMNLFILCRRLASRIRDQRRACCSRLARWYDPFIAARPRCAQLRLLPGRSVHRGGNAVWIVTLAPEGGAHQSIAEPLIGLAQDGLAAFEPAFVDELAVILAFALDYIQKDGDGDASERNWLRDETGGSVYLRLSTRSIEQIKRTMTPELKQAVVDGAYWLRKPGPNCQVVVAYTGAVAPEAIQAVGLMAEDRRDVGLLAVTSADRLNAGWTAALRARERGLVHARSHIERLFADLPGNCCIVSVLDGHPATLAWLGAVNGHRVRPWASSISARPAPSHNSTNTTGSTRMPSLRRRKRSRPVDPFGISACFDRLIRLV